MRFAIGVAAEACLASQSGLITVAGVALGAGLVLGHLMQTEQGRRLVTSRTCWRRGDPLWPVRPVAVGAAARDLAMGGARLRLMAARARHFLRRAAVRLVAIDAFGVAGGRAVRLGLVTACTGRGDGSSVGLVTLRALLVTPIDLVLLSAVASRAARQQGFGAMRQTFVTAGTLLVATRLSDATHLDCVAIAA